MTIDAQIDLALATSHGGFKLSSNCLDVSKRLESMQRYARALCNMVGCGDCFDNEQVRWVKSYLTTKRFDPKVVNDIENLIAIASEMPEEELVWDTCKMMEDESLKFSSIVLIHDMYRTSSAMGFPEPQVDMIRKVAEGLDVPKPVHLRIRRMVREEQEIVEQYMSFTLASKAA